MLEKTSVLLLTIVVLPAFGCEKSLLEIAKRLDDPHAYTRVENTTRCEGIYGGFRNAGSESILSLVKFHQHQLEGKIRYTGELLLTWDQSHTNDIKLTGRYLRPNFLYRMDDYEVSNYSYSWPLSDLHAILEFPKDSSIDIANIGLVVSVETTDEPPSIKYLSVSSPMSPKSTEYDIGFVANEDLQKLNWHLIDNTDRILYESAELAHISKNGLINIGIEKEKIINSRYFKLIFYGTLSNGAKPIQEFTLYISEAR